MTSYAQYKNSTIYKHKQIEIKTIVNQQLLNKNKNKQTKQIAKQQQQQQQSKKNKQNNNNNK